MPVSPENMFLSIISCLSANSAKVIFLLVCLHSLPVDFAHSYSSFTYWAHLLSLPVFDLVSWEDPKILILSNDSSITRGHWIPINADDSSNYPSHRLSINWSFSHLSIPLCFYYNPNTGNTNQSLYIPLHK